MPREIVLQLPEDAYLPLLERARLSGRTPEDLAAECLVSVLRQDEDPLLALAGIFHSDIVGVSDRHDEYIGQALSSEMGARPDE